MKRTNSLIDDLYNVTESTLNWLQLNNSRNASFSSYDCKAAL